MWTVLAVVIACIPCGPALTLPRQERGKFGLDSIVGATLPVLHPLVAAGSRKCELIKSYLGVTYGQIQEKSVPDFYESLSLDLIKPRGNVKYDFDSQVSKYLDLSRPLVILIHGFLESSEGQMVQAIASELLKIGNHTVMALDGRDVLTMEYFRSSTYVRFMGERLGLIITDLVKGHDASQLWLVGHSLGAHIAGIAGKTAAQRGVRVARIVGLDPAGPCFSAADADARLAPNDADYVQVVHSNAGIFGIIEPAGDQDFYLNGGMSQPGCMLATCDHSRAWEVFAETIRYPGNFPGRLCSNWSTFRDGGCSDNEQAFLGWGSTGEGTKGSYFLTTAPAPPYGLKDHGTS